MPRACIDERDVEWVIDPDGDFDMDEAIPNPMARELYKLMGRYVYTFGRSYESINGYIVYECMMMDRDLRYNVMYALHDHGFEIRHIDSYSWWMTNERLMSEVTYTEGDIHIIVHECMEDYVDNVKFGEEFYKTRERDKILTCDGDDNIDTTKGNGGMPLAPKPAVIEARVWDKLAAALSFVESRDDDRAYNAASGALGRWQMKRCM